MQAISQAGGEPAEFYGLVTEVYRRSRRQSNIEEADRFDTRPGEEVALESMGVTYAQVRLLASRPTVFAPPREDAEVHPAADRGGAVGGPYAVLSHACRSEGQTARQRVVADADQAAGIVHRIRPAAGNRDFASEADPRQVRRRTRPAP